MCLRVRHREANMPRLVMPSENGLVAKLDEHSVDEQGALRHELLQRREWRAVDIPELCRLDVVEHGAEAPRLLGRPHDLSLLETLDERDLFGTCDPHRRARRREPRLLDVERFLEATPRRRLPEIHLEQALERLGRFVLKHAAVDPLEPNFQYVTPTRSASPRFAISSSALIRR